jgi:hypothetical protein
MSLEPCSGHSIPAIQNANSALSCSLQREANLSSVDLSTPSDPSEEGTLWTAINVRLDERHSIMSSDITPSYLDSGNEPGPEFNFVNGNAIHNHDDLKSNIQKLFAES